jgi:glycerol-3-phosphate dehydrogenase (NAD(P)+)
MVSVLAQPPSTTLYNPSFVVMGAGSWGTAVAIHLARYNSKVTLFCRTETTARTLNNARENKSYLPGYTFPSALNITADSACLRQAIVLIAVPIAGLASALTQACHQGALAVITLCKGLEANTGRLPHELATHLNCSLPMGVLSGPSFAQEVAQALPTALTVATEHDWLRTTIQTALHHGTMRIYTSADVVGVEIAGAIKNIIAVACGVSDGLNLGLNARAALITRGLAETTRLTLALGGKIDTLMGLTGVGDLVLTCTGHLSRNRSYGMLLAQGDSPSMIEAKLGHVAEGARCVGAVASRAAQLGVDMPITTIVAQLVAGELSAQSALSILLAREAKPE